jgi:hypothetical protein
MTFEKAIFTLSFGMSEMAKTHKNDTISNALASLSDRLTRIHDKVALAKLSQIDRDLISYYHSHK